MSEENTIQTRKRKRDGEHGKEHDEEAVRMKRYKQMKDEHDSCLLEDVSFAISHIDFTSLSYMTKESWLSVEQKHIENALQAISYDRQLDAYYDPEGMHHHFDDDDCAKEFRCNRCQKPAASEPTVTEDEHGNIG